VTIPRGGSQKEALDFAHRHVAWVEQQLQKQPAESRPPKAWVAGTGICFRGDQTVLTVESNPKGCFAKFADQVVPVAEASGDLRAAIQAHLWRLAAEELMPRTWELAKLHALPVRRVAVRNQRSRWGSCSIKGTISLNWRLIQTPALVRDYIILHELMHLREMNHSRRFWRWVEQVCPRYLEAEAWLKQHASLLQR
jgi:hypothetical protein